jgi:hypothetical protein
MQYEGGKISVPGTYSNLDIERYHGDITDGFSVSSTGLRKIFHKSAAHFYDTCYLNPDRAPNKPTEAMILGSAAHHLLLGERNFLSRFAVRPDKAPDGTGRDWNGNNLACKAWKQDKAAKGLSVIDSDDWSAIQRIRDQLSKEPMVQAGLLDGKVEHSIIARDERTGIWIKARPDVDPASLGDYVDLKLTADISDDGLEKSIASFGYGMQGALVLECAEQVHGRAIADMTFTLVFVESERPHCVQVRTLDATVINEGVKNNRAALNLLDRCLKTNTWPGPSGAQSDARIIGQKPWITERDSYRRRQIEAQLSIGEQT